MHAELEALRGALPADFPLGPDDVALLVRRRLRCRSSWLRSAGRAAACRCSTRPQARGRCFDRLFLIGLVARRLSAQPARGSAAPGRAARARARRCSRRSRSRSSASTRSASCSPSCSPRRRTSRSPGRSRPRTGAPARARASSERLRWGGRFERAEHARPVLAPAASGSLPRLGLEEHLLRAALFGPRARLAAVLPAALRGSAGEILARGPASQAEALAQARVAVLREVEPAASARRRSAPTSASWARSARRAIRARRRSTSPRSSGSRRCGWQTLLERLLRWRRRPTRGARCRGSTSACSDRRCTGRSSASSRRPARAGPRTPSWPRSRREAAARRARRGGRSAPGPRARARAARAPVPGARAQPRPRRGGAARDPGARRASAASRSPTRTAAPARSASGPTASSASAGRERLTDFKTGKPISDAKGADTRREHFLATIASREDAPAARVCALGRGRRRRAAPVSAPGRWRTTRRSTRRRAATPSSARPSTPRCAGSSRPGTRAASSRACSETISRRSRARASTARSRRPVCAATRERDGASPAGWQPARAGEGARLAGAERALLEPVPAGRGAAS